MKQSGYDKTLQLAKKVDKIDRLSYILMGFAHIKAGQIVKGVGFFLLEIAFIFYMINKGVTTLLNLITLGTVQQGMVYDEAEEIYVRVDGDNSMLMLLYGVVALFVIIGFVILWRVSVRTGFQALINKKAGKKNPGFIEDIRSLFDKNIHMNLLFVPLLGLFLFTVLPLVYMILMAFTNYDVNHQPPGNLFDWVGLRNFNELLLSSGKIAQTFWPVLGWTLVWAVFATFSNYFLGILLAVLINRDGVKLKKLWRTVFVLSIAIPSFVSLLVIRTMLNKSGVINMELISLGFIKDPLPFLTNATWARASVIVANMWIGIPFTMLIATGILTNIPSDLYESAKIDGAGPFMMFKKITMPYIFFITTPYLISNFIANVNNFNPIYFMTEGGPLTLEYFKGAGKTDLLVTWLYKLTKDSFDYCYAAAIGILIFGISATVSLILYNKSNASRNEEGFQL
ncbi:MAG: sugar ABC transporter permease [Lachnospiraceae bacterium]|nr:sugar ABC transporter permease [Lachnospiraceae bacterium]